MEYTPEEVPISVDIAVIYAGVRKLAVEVNGPMHYYSNEPYRKVEMPASQWRRRLLEAVGWQVAVVPYWEWDDLRDKRDASIYTLV